MKSSVFEFRTDGIPLTITIAKQTTLLFMLRHSFFIQLVGSNTFKLIGERAGRSLLFKELKSFGSNIERIRILYLRTKGIPLDLIIRILMTLIELLKIWVNSLAHQVRMNTKTTILSLHMRFVRRL
jgi:hypothetical protein